MLTGTTHTWLWLFPIAVGAIWLVPIVVLWRQRPRDGAIPQSYADLLIRSR